MVFGSLRVLVAPLFSVLLPFLVLLSEDSSKPQSAVAQPAAPAVAAPRIVRNPVMPDKFAGIVTDSWPSWFKHFQQVVTINGWNAAKQGQYIGISLTGEAQLYFQSLPAATRQGPIATLTLALQNQFAPAQRVDLHRATFKAAKQSKDKALGAFCETVRYAARLAYPTMAAAGLDVLGRDQFIQGLDSRAMRVRVNSCVCFRGHSVVSLWCGYSIAPLLIPFVRYFWFPEGRLYILSLFPLERSQNYHCCQCFYLLHYSCFCLWYLWLSPCWYRLCCHYDQCKVLGAAAISASTDQWLTSPAAIYLRFFCTSCG